MYPLAKKETEADKQEEPRAWSPRLYDLCYADLPKYKDGRDQNIQTGIRPVVIVSNNQCNRYSPVVTVLPITSQIKGFVPTHLRLSRKIARQIGLKGESTILAEGIMALGKKRILYRIGRIADKEIQKAVDRIIDIQLGRIISFHKADYMD